MIGGPAAPAARPPAKAPAAAREKPHDPAKQRLVALDALRGAALVMLLLVNIAGIRSALPYQLDHAEWHGVTFADTWFPVFLFTMGGAMAFSSTARRAGPMLRRVILLFAFGVGLALVRTGEPNPAGILQKIAVAYLIAWLVLRLPRRAHLPVAIGIMAAMWAAFTWVSAPGVIPGSWQQDTNFAAWLDRIVIGRPATEGFATALMASVNVLGGLVVIRSVRGLDPQRALKRILWWAGGALAVALLLAVPVPVNKRIWTPSFAILSHGAACVYLAVYWVVAELWQRRRAVRPFTVLGRNPILIYVGFTVLQVVLTPVRVPLMDAATGVMPPLAASLGWSAAMLAAAITLSDWLDRRRIYLKV